VKQLKAESSELKCGKIFFFFLKFEKYKKREYLTEIFSFMEFFGNFSQRKKKKKGLVSILESITSIGEPKKDYWL
jgi:hypothetical protein